MTVTEQATDPVPFAPFRPPIVPREWGFMVVRASTVLALAIALVAVTVTLASPAPTRWEVRTTGSASVGSLSTARYMCATIATTRTLAQELYVLGAAIPSNATAAHAWASGTTFPLTGPSAISTFPPAVVCAYRATVAKYGPDELVPDIVIVIAPAHSVQTYYLTAIPTRALAENTIAPESVWF